MPRIMHLVVVIAALCGIARGASAQSNRFASSETPKAEVGVYGGLWNLEPSGQVGFGGRVTTNRNEWLGTEISVEGKDGENDGGTHRALVVNAVAKAADSHGRAIALFTAGVAIGAGSRRTISPMVGVGLQTLWVGGIVAARGELQHFRSGLIEESNKTRVVVSLVVALR
jgi:hypothetical protein